MAEITSTITSKGQVTIPAEIRRHLGLNKNDKIAFVLEADGSVHLRPPRYPTIESLAGAAGSLKQPMPWKEVLRIAHEDAAERKFGKGNG